MHIGAYTYESDVHCTACTRLAASRMKVDHEHPSAIGEPCQDSNGIDYDLVDVDGNLIHPVFDIDEHGFINCTDCDASYPSLS